MSKPTEEAAPFFCARCAAELRPGAGTFYHVQIEAFADPTPPRVDAVPSAAELRREIERLVELMKGLSEREAMDQVHRRLTMQLCVACYWRWIENPAGEHPTGNDETPNDE